MSIKILYISFITILCIVPVISQVRRNKNEGTFNVPASNVAGNGNVLVSGFFNGSYLQRGLRFESYVNLSAGVTNILQVYGKTGIRNLTQLSTTEGKMQLTMPDNNKLRFFGAAVIGSIYLSTESDTLTQTATRDKPEYHAYIRPALILDLDWLAKIKRLPLKNYLLLSTVDNPDILYLYSQILVCFGTELKLYRNSYSVDIGAAFYKDVNNKENNFIKGYRQRIIWIEPAMRYRLFDRYSIIGALRFLIFQQLSIRSPVEPNYFRISFGLEAPLLYRETNTEAIRSLILLERRKERGDSLEKLTVAKDTIEGRINPIFRELNIEEEKDSEREVLRTKEEIYKKMEEIEKILEELE
ncbi:MAG: hypothetical protein N2053_01035 [Chitinispirillaceae bacterium]|nr:hypothetical protein [Chitinispirillaceae bacterium]